MLEGDIGSQHVEDVGLAYRSDVDVVVRIIVGAELPRTRMLVMILLG